MSSVPHHRRLAFNSLNLPAAIYNAEALKPVGDPAKLVVLGGAKMDKGLHHRDIVRTAD
jgi:hypothetical protein